MACILETLSNYDRTQDNQFITKIMGENVQKNETEKSEICNENSKNADEITDDKAHKTIDYPENKENQVEHSTENNSFCNEDDNRDIEESRTDDEEDVALNFDASKSDEENSSDDDLGAEEEVSENGEVEDKTEEKNKPDTQMNSSGNEGEQTEISNVATKENPTHEQQDPLSNQENVCNNEEKIIENNEAHIEDTEENKKEKEDECQKKAESNEVNDKSSVDPIEDIQKEAAVNVSNDSKENDSSCICVIEDEKQAQNEDDTNKKDNDNDVSEVIDDKSKENEDNLEVTNCPLLKETLSKPKNDRETKYNEAEDDVEMDEDFDPSLLCPDIAMEVDEAPVMTTNNEMTTNSEGSKSPVLYEPIFSMYVDEMTGAEVHFDLSLEEEKIRQETYGESNPVQFTKIHCTACNVHLGSALDGQSNRFVHPLLKVLICKNCYHFYTSGEFEKDEDGSELYCRWCGQGGQVLCCSNCEMVFCKKCIRINFDRRKLTEIKESDDWLCFRCNPSQITHLKIHCAEFMEYVRRETFRASTLDNAVEFMKMDHCQCCLPQKKKAVEPNSADQPKKKKRKPTVQDPDYDPYKDTEVDSTQPSTSKGFQVIPPANISAAIVGAKVVPITPKPSDANTNSGFIQIQAAKQQSPNTFSPRTNVASRVKVQLPGTNAGSRQTNSSPGYIKILPGGIRVPGNTPTPRIQTQPVRQRIAPAPPQMKNEWFEKTLRAAVRVNSNLSYTLTQLNRAQAAANSVESLAVVHNKLQEILSTSINSLIQIRKNLRTEFIQGIKNIRFTSKPTPPQPKTSSSQDDDVIFISSANSPVTPLSPPPQNNAAPPSITLPPSVSLNKRSSPKINNNNSVENSTPSTSRENDKPRPFLRVKSLTALQNVTAECITIPDDPLPVTTSPPLPPPPLIPLSKTPEPIIIDKEDDCPEKQDSDKDVQIISVIPAMPTEKRSELPMVTDTFENEQHNSKGLKMSELNKVSKGEIKKIKDIKVILNKSKEIERRLKNESREIKGT